MKHQWELVELIREDKIPGQTPMTKIVKLCLQCGWVKTTEDPRANFRRDSWRFRRDVYRRANETIRASTIANGAPICDGMWPEGWTHYRRYWMFLDDIRQPPKVMNIRWVVVRSFEQAVAYVEKNGMPYKISFDHDLGDNVPTGFDFAKWLVNRHLDGTDLLLDNFKYVVHSANPPGAANIKGLLDNFLAFLNVERQHADELA